ncbi:MULTISPECIES: hypothetical protein [Streptomyces]|uniref:hypothetical protein n=1 Tax=Streptomyces TaxID=1883 RepID=UPI0029A7445A|nr:MULTISPECIES: hypothetical protein [unclassified Streptomyces]MDX2545870.1 hypothetical protein [Streptomyces sp. WI04-05B]MDX2586429.1 hypothetical protein [Streptomyces sp. WI04-05A]
MAAETVPPARIGCPRTPLTAQSVHRLDHGQQRVTDVGKQRGAVMKRQKDNDNGDTSRLGTASCHIGSYIRSRARPAQFDIKGHNGPHVDLLQEINLQPRKLGQAASQTA